MKNSIIALAILLGMSSCAPINKNLLVGSWQATGLLENGQPMDADIEVIHFQFNTNDQYTYAGTLNYHEAGTYAVESKYLYTMDTLNQATTEKAVEIIQLTKDSLRLKMSDGGKERVMFLKKI